MNFFQLAATLKFKLAFGDIKTAFLNSPEMQREERLYMELPRGGIQGVQEGGLLEVLRPVYGLNEAPRDWIEMLHKALIKIGYIQYS